MDAATRKAKLADAKTWAGYRSASIARQTGTLVVVVDGFEQGLESPDDRYAPRWFTMCDEHSTCCGHDTLALAKSHASDPQGWCEECRGDGIKEGTCDECGAHCDKGWDYLCVPCREKEDADAEGTEG